MYINEIKQARCIKCNQPILSVKELLDNVTIIESDNSDVVSISKVKED